MELALPFPRLNSAPDDEYHLAGVRITQFFDMNPQHYRAFGLPGHEGVDFGLGTNTPLYAVHDGTVSKADNNEAGAYGREVRVVWDDNDTTWETISAHCEKVLVVDGQSVKAGDLIALSGNTGYVMKDGQRVPTSTGAHLHFSLLRHGARTASRNGGFFYHFIDPLPYLRPASAIIAPPPPNSTLYRVQVREGVRARQQPALKKDNIMAMLPYLSQVYLDNDESVVADGYVWRKLATGQRQMRQLLDGLWCAEMPTSNRPRYLAKVV